MNTAVMLWPQLDLWKCLKHNYWPGTPIILLRPQNRPTEQLLPEAFLVTLRVTMSQSPKSSFFMSYERAEMSFWWYRQTSCEFLRREEVHTEAGSMYKVYHPHSEEPRPTKLVDVMMMREPVQNKDRMSKNQYLKKKAGHLSSRRLLQYLDQHLRAAGRQG